MKTLFTAEAISMGGRSGTIQSPDGLLNVTLGNPLENGAEKRGPNPELLFAGAYSACYHGALKNAAKKLGTRSKARPWAHWSASSRMTRVAIAWPSNCMRNFRALIAPKANASWRRRTKPAPTRRPCGATPPSRWWWINSHREPARNQDTLVVMLTTSNQTTNTKPPYEQS